MTEHTTRLWHMTSQTGRVAECRLTETAAGTYEVTVLHDGIVVMSEVYVTRVEARMRAWSMNRKLLEGAWGSGSQPASSLPR